MPAAPVPVIVAGTAVAAAAVTYLVMEYLKAAGKKKALAAEAVAKMGRRRQSSDVTLPRPEAPPPEATEVEEKKKKIAILGGAFNPPTNQHIQLATEIVHSGCVDAVWLMPCGPRPDKPNMGTTAQQRLVMCEIAVNTSVSATFPVAVTDHETQEAMATYDSLCYLRETYPSCTFSFVIGSDWLQPGTDLREWTSKEGVTGDRLVSEFDFIVIPRPGYEVKDLSAFGPRFSWMDLPHGFQLVESSASSTEIRKRAKFSWAKHSADTATLSTLDGLVAPGVHAYILRHRLYRKANWGMVRHRAERVRDLARASRESSGAPSVAPPPTAALAHPS